MKDFIHIWNISNVSQLDQKVYPGFKSGETSKKASTHPAYYKSWAISFEWQRHPTPNHCVSCLVGHWQCQSLGHGSLHTSPCRGGSVSNHLVAPAGLPVVRLRDDKPCSCWWKDPHLGDSCQSIRDIGKFQASWWRKVSGEFARNLGGDVALAKIQDNFTISCGQLVPTI